MSNLRQTVRFYSQWSHEKTQRVYYHTNGVEHIALVSKGAWASGQTRKGSVMVATMIGSPQAYAGPYTTANRLIITSAIRRFKEIEAQE